MPAAHDGWDIRASPHFSRQCWNGRGWASSTRLSPEHQLELDLERVLKVVVVFSRSDRCWSFLWETCNRRWTLLDHVHLSKPWLVRARVPHHPMVNGKIPVHHCALSCFCSASQWSDKRVNDITNRGKCRYQTVNEILPDKRTPAFRWVIQTACFY